MVDSLTANIGIGIVLTIRSSPLATVVPVLTCTGIAPVALGFVLDKVSVMNRLLLVDCQKRFPLSQTLHVSGRRLWSRLNIDRGLGTTG